MRELGVFALAGLGTYLARGAFILAVGERRIPDWAERVLAYLGPAALAALTASLLVTGGVVAYVTDVARMVATAVAVLVALVTRSFIWTFVAGMGVWWAVGAVTGH